MRLSRWGRSPYETHEDIRLESELLGQDVTVISEGADAEIVVVTSQVPMGKEELSRAPSMQLLVTTTSGWDHIDLDVFNRAGVKVCRLPEARRDAVVEATMAMLIWGLRKMGVQSDWAVQGLWGRKELPALSPICLKGARVGVIGLGVIGSRVAEVLAVLGVEVWGSDPKGVPPSVRHASVREMLGHCDAVTFHCDLNESSNGMVSAEMIALSHPSLVLVNTARGGLIDVNACIEALTRGELGALALDVFNQEPYLEMDRSASHPNLFFTPHSSGYHRDLCVDVREGLHRTVKAHLEGVVLPYRVT